MYVRTVLIRCDRCGIKSGIHTNTKILRRRLRMQSGWTRVRGQNQLEDFCRKCSMDRMIERI